MKKLMMMSMLLISLLMMPLANGAMAQTVPATPAATQVITTPAPDKGIFSLLSGDYTLLANPTNKWKLMSAPSVNCLIASTLNDVVTFNAKAAFMTTQDNGDNVNKTVLVGPWILVNPMKAIAGKTNLKVAEGVNLFAGLGVLINFVGLDGLMPKDLKRQIYPGGSIGATF